MLYLILRLGTALHKKTPAAIIAQTRVQGSNLFFSPPVRVGRGEVRYETSPDVLYSSKVAQDFKGIACLGQNSQIDTGHFTDTQTVALKPERGFNVFNGY